MPTYEFRTPDGSIIERIFKISEVPDSVTLEDGSVAARIISGGAGLLFKGSGFYITDYGKDGKKDQRAAPSSGESKTETKTETKTEPKSESKPAAPAAPAAPKAE